MKSKVIGPILLFAIALMALTANSATATTIAVGGVTQTKAVTLEATIASGGSALLTDTSNFTANTCTTSFVKVSDSTAFTGTTVSGPISTLSFSNCSEGNPTVDAAGTLSVERIGTTANGTVRSNGAKITVPSFFGTLTCTTSSTDIGTVTGALSGSAHLDVNAVLSCTVTGSARWSGTYTFTGGTQEWYVVS
jgi:hypothetical protein